MFKAGRISILLGTTALALICSPALAATSDDMKAEIAALRARLDQLEAQQSTTAAAAAQAQAQAAQAATAAQAAKVAKAVVPPALQKDQNGNILGVQSN